jgi:hypothetical protein
MMDLPRELPETLRDEIGKWEEERHMPYVTRRGKHGRGKQEARGK